MQVGTLTSVLCNWGFDVFAWQGKRKVKVVKMTCLVRSIFQDLKVRIHPNAQCACQFIWLTAKVYAEKLRNWLEKRLISSTITIGHIGMLRIYSLLFHWFTIIKALPAAFEGPSIRTLPTAGFVNCLGWWKLCCFSIMGGKWRSIVLQKTLFRDNLKRCHGSLFGEKWKQAFLVKVKQKITMGTI